MRRLGHFALLLHVDTNAYYCFIVSFILMSMPNIYNRTVYNIEILYSAVMCISGNYILCLYVIII